MRKSFPLLLLLFLVVLPMSTVAAQFSRWAVNAGYNYATYPHQKQHYAGFGIGLQVPLGGMFRLNARYYDQHSSDDFFSDGAAVDLGLQIGVGNRVGEVSLLAGISGNGVADDYVSGGISPHFGVMGRLWLFRYVGVYGEWIRRPVGGWSDRQTGVGFGVTIRQWP